MFGRLKNLWALSGSMHVEAVEAVEAVGEEENIVMDRVVTIRPHPKGEAKIIELTSIVEQDFPAEEDI